MRRHLLAFYKFAKWRDNAPFTAILLRKETDHTNFALNLFLRIREGTFFLGGGGGGRVGEFWYFFPKESVGPPSRFD